MLYRQLIMKFLSTQISYFLNQGQIKRNINALLQYIAFLIAVIAVFTVLFHLIMTYWENRGFSWLTGLYWTLTVMSTLGFGDITFHSDLGRAFTIVVLLSGIVLLLIVLPFAFIRFFYAPWIEAQIHVQCPRAAPPDINGHVIICKYESVAPNLIKRLAHRSIPYFVIEPDPVAAVQLHNDGISVVQGDIDSRRTYERLRVEHAALVFLNAADTTNTNIALTIREIAPDVKLVAVAENEDSIDILELSGVTEVLPLKSMLGESLASRINAGGQRSHIVRTLDRWRVAEFTVHNTRFEGMLLRDAKFREVAGVNIVGVWDRGVLQPARPDMVLTDLAVPVAVGTKEQINKLETMLAGDGTSPLPTSVLVIGGGKVGGIAAASLKEDRIKVFVVDRNPELADGLREVADRVTIGDAADRDTLMRGGLKEASLVILSTNDDAVNIYLSIYCRRLNSNIRIVSRITHERNLEAIHRAGTDFVLSYSMLGAEAVLSSLLGREPLIIGEDVELFNVPVPPLLEGKTLADSGVGAETGLVVLAVHENGRVNADLAPALQFPADGRLTLLGTPLQLMTFKRLYRN